MAAEARGWLLPESFPALASLSRSELDTLCFAARVRRLEHAEVLIREGHRHDGMVFLVSGELRVLKEADGAEGALTIGHLRAPVIVGETSIIDGTAANATVVVGSERATVVTVPAGTVRHLMIHNVAWADALIGLSRDYLMLRALRANPVLFRLPEAGDEAFLREAEMITLLRGHAIRGADDVCGGWLVAKGIGSVGLGRSWHAVGTGCFALAGEDATLRAVSDLRLVMLPGRLLEVWAGELGIGDWPRLIKVRESERLCPA